jgi:hypothetical protein
MRCEAKGEKVRTKKGERPTSGPHLSARKKKMKEALVSWAVKAKKLLG